IDRLLIAFLRGALATWIRFSAEFAPGGLIDESTASERQLAWMPATNDASEGALGSYRVRMRDFPSVTLHQYNAEAMFRQNDSQDFIGAVFLPEDHLFIMREGRRIDASGLEAARRKELVDFHIRVAQLTQEKILAAQRKAAEEIRRRILLPLVTSLEGIPKLTIPELKDQL
ncbi:hypothetical protein C8J57DRAFT_1010376, partial [Mycena rebaudengoi]